MSVHHDFDKLTESIATGSDHLTVLHELSSITARCIAGHTIYRLP